MKMDGLELFPVLAKLMLLSVPSAAYSQRCSSHSPTLWPTFLSTFTCTHMVNSRHTTHTKFDTGATANDTRATGAPVSWRAALVPASGASAAASCP